MKANSYGEEAVRDYGKQRITALLQNAPTAIPIKTGDTDVYAIASVQDLLRGHGYDKMPTLASASYGKFGPATTSAIKAFKTKAGGHGQIDETVDHLLVSQLATTKAISPVCSLIYHDLVLKQSMTPWNQILELVSIVEGAGKFAALNLNTDKAGLSFGILQWAQKPKRLLEIVQQFNTNQPNETAQIFGNSSVMQGLIAHLNKPRGGVDASGVSTDPNFNLIDDPWKTRFVNAGRSQILQNVQIALALGDFKGYRTTFMTYASKITSERGVAFMIDLVNQHGATGAKTIYTTSVQQQMSELQTLDALRTESVETVKRNHPNDPNIHAGTFNRRSFFINTQLLSDQAAQLP